MTLPRRSGEPKSLAQLMPKVYPAPDQLDAARVFAWWSRAVPPRVARHARPVRMRRGVLTVHVATSAWAQELQFLHEQLLGAIQRAAPEAGVRELRFRVGELPPLPERREQRPQSHEAPPVVALPEELARTLARVPHDDLREAIANAAVASLAKRQRGGR